MVRVIAVIKLNNGIQTEWRIKWLEMASLRWHRSSDKSQPSKDAGLGLSPRRGAGSAQAWAWTGGLCKWGTEGRAMWLEHNDRVGAWLEDRYKKHLFLEFFFWLLGKVTGRLLHHHVTGSSASDFEAESRLWGRRQAGPQQSGLTPIPGAARAWCCTERTTDVALRASRGIHCVRARERRRAGWELPQHRK